MHVTAEHVRTLREKTGAGMMECKKALLQSSGDFDAAIEWLRKQGLAMAAKKSARTAAEGLIGHYVNADETLIAMVEVHCETDFVAKNPDFQQFVAAIATLVGHTTPHDLSALLAARMEGGTVEAVQTGLIARIGENIGVRRFVVRRANGQGQRLGAYVHAGNKIGVAITFEDPHAKLSLEARKDVAMHVAAMHPTYLRRDLVPAEVVAKEREIQRAQLVDEKKPPEILEKIVTGRLNKYFGDSCLEEQTFVKDPEGKRTVAQVLRGIDPGIRIVDIVRFQVGETVSEQRG